MKTRSVWLTILAGVAVAGAAAAGVYLAARYWPLLKPGAAEAAKEAAVAPAPAAESDIAFWTCVMHPSVRSPGPSQCPVCQMDLIPVRRGAGLTLTQRQKDLLPVHTEAVGYHHLAREIRTVGTLTYNERKLAAASTRVSGWIERLYVDFTGTRVRLWYTCPDHPGQRYDAPGQCPDCTKPLLRHADHLVEIYSPELLTAQEEYLQALQAVERLKESNLEVIRTTAEATVTAVAAKMRLLGLTEDQIEAVRQRGKAVTTLTLYTPIGGTVIEVKTRLGEHVKAGDTLFRIADLDALWMLADVYEYELPWIRRGMVAEITGDAFPGEVVRGTVAFVYPFLHTETRTVKALVEVPNADGRLKPWMAVTARLKVSLADIYARERGPLPAYACPMHPWITSEAPGHCSICGMALEAVREADDDDQTKPAAAPESAAATPPALPTRPAPGYRRPGRSDLSRPAARVVLTCGMPGHPQFEPGHAPADGRCPVCGMTLREETLAAAPSEGSAAPGETPRLRFKYVCPDHPGVVSEAAGTCPEDGRPLVMTGEVLAVPVSAVLDTGERAVVYVDLGEGGYVAREVTLGPEGWTYDDAGNRRERYVPVLAGVKAGDLVVTRGNFLIDSQSQITGAAAQAYGGQIGGAEAPPAPAHRH